MSKLLWHQDDIVALLAWLDFCIEQDLNFDETIQQQLTTAHKKATGKDVEFRMKAVTMKLYDLCRNREDRPSKTDLRAKGSRCFDDFPSDFRQEIEAAVRRYGNDNQKTNPESSAGPEPPIDTVFPLSKSAGKVSAGSTRPQNTSTGASLMRSEIASRDIPARRIRVTNVPSPTTKATLRAALAQKNAEITNLRKTWHQEVDSLRATLSQNTLTELSLRAEIQHLVIARQARELAGKDPLEYELFQLNQTVWSLNRRVYEMQKLAVFAQMDGERRDGIETRVVDEVMGNIASELQMLGLGRDADRRVVVSNVEDNGDLGALLRTVFEGTSEAKDRVTKLTSVVSKFDAGVLMRTLVVAALRDWVFATAFPDFVPRNMRLLQAYRNIIITHDGWNRLHNLELAAYDSLVDEEGFREILVPRKAKELTARLLKALAPLFSQTKEDLHMESWGDSIDACEERRFRLSEMFEAAIHLKAATVKADQSFEFVIYQPGTMFRRHEGAETDSGNDEHQRTDHDRTNWLLASFHTYASDASSPRNALGDAIVKSKNMVTRSQEERLVASLYRKIILVPTTSPADSNQRETTHHDEGVTDSFSDSSEDDNNSDTTYEKGGELCNEGQSKCELCGRVFIYRRSLKRHSHKNSCAKCLECNLYFAKDAELRIHNRSSHPKETSRTKVQKETTASASLGDVEGTRPPASANAESTNATSKATNDIGTPGRDTFQKIDNRFVCARCDKRFYHRTAFIEHPCEEHPGANKETDLVREAERILKRKPSQVDGDVEAKSKKLRVWHQTARQWVDPVKDSPTEGREEAGGENATSQQSADSDRARSQLSDSPRTIQKNTAMVRYKCSVCPKDYSSAGNGDRHFESHPKCLQEGKGHIIRKNDRKAGGNKVTCQICGSTSPFVSSHETQVPQNNPNPMVMERDTKQTSDPVAYHRHSFK